MVKISVILTTYNSQDTIQRTLDSILKQDGVDMDFTLELLIADDCSTDKTPKIIQQYGLPFFTSETNSGGPNKGRNRCLKECTGDFICFIDHDDEWLPNKISKQLEHIKKVPVVTSGYIVKDALTGQTRINSSTCKNGFQYFPKNETFIKKISKLNDSQRHYFGSIMIQKELKNILFEEEYGMVDFDYIAKIFENNDSIEVCEPLFIRYVDGPNLSLNERYRKNDFDYSLRFIKTYGSLYPTEVKQGVKRLNGSLARYYYLVGRMAEARTLFLKSGLSTKTMLYYLSTYWGSNFVKRKFNVFG